MHIKGHAMNASGRIRIKGHVFVRKGTQDECQWAGLAATLNRRMNWAGFDAD